MRNALSLKSLIIKTQVLKFLIIFVPGILLIYILARLLYSSVDIYYINIVALLSFSFATRESLNSFYLVTMYSLRKTTRSYILDVLWIKFIFLFFIISCLFLTYILIAYENFLKTISFFTIGNIVNFYILTFIISICFDLCLVRGIKNQQNFKKIQLKDILISLAFFVISILTVFLAIELSLAIGYFMACITLLVYIFLFDDYIKKIITKKLRFKSLIRISFALTIVSSLLVAAEYKSGNSKYVFDNRFFNRIMSVSDIDKKIKSNQIDTFYLWTRMMNDKNITNQKFAQAFEKLAELCPPEDRTNLFLIDCEGCTDSFYTHTSNSIKGLSESDVSERLSFLLDQKSEYSKLIAINYYLIAKNLPEDIQDKFKGMFKTGDDPLTQIGQLASLKKESLKNTSIFSVLSKNNSKCSKKKP